MRSARLAPQDIATVCCSIYQYHGRLLLHLLCTAIVAARPQWLCGVSSLHAEQLIYGSVHANQPVIMQMKEQVQG